MKSVRLCPVVCVLNGTYWSVSHIEMLSKSSLTEPCCVGGEGASIGPAFGRDDGNRGGGGL